jgi:flagellar basal-body rod modification protein FlgD
MSSTDGVSSLFTTTGYSTQDTKASSSLDKDGFLKLLTAQMSNQDPQSSQDPSQYFQTISQMTVVEQLTNLATQSSITSAQNLLGKTVGYTDKTGAAQTGKVEGVKISGSTPLLTVAGKPGIDPSAITSITDE